MDVPQIKIDTLVVNVIGCVCAWCLVVGESERERAKESSGRGGLIVKANKTPLGTGLDCLWIL